MVKPRASGGNSKPHRVSQLSRPPTPDNPPEAPPATTVVEYAGIVLAALARLALQPAPAHDQARYCRDQLISRLSDAMGDCAYSIQKIAEGEVRP